MPADVLALGQQATNLDHVGDDALAEATNGGGVLGQNPVVGRDALGHAAPPRLRRTGGDHFGRNFGTLRSDSGSFVPLCSVFALSESARDPSKTSISSAFPRARGHASNFGRNFLGIMLDPFVDGRSGVAGTGGPALAFAPEREELPDDIALAYAKLLKAPAPSLPSPASGGGLGWGQRWTVWGAGYGGSNRTSGDPAVVGSHDLAARAAGGAAGFDYHLSR